MKTFKEYVNEANPGFKIAKQLKALYPKNQSGRTFELIIRNPKDFVYSLEKDIFKFGTENSIGTGAGIEFKSKDVESKIDMSISDFTELLDTAGVSKI